MVYLHVKTKKEKKYYSIRKSTRKGKKIITQNIFSLGQDLQKNKTEELKKKYPNIYKEIEKELKKKIIIQKYNKKTDKQNIKENKYFNQNQSLQIKSILNHFNKKYPKKELKNKKKIIEIITKKFISENIAIEKHFLNLKEISEILLGKKFPKNKSVKDILAVINNEKALSFITTKIEKINIETLNQLHQIVLEGRYQTKGFRTHKIKLNFNISKYSDIKEDLIKLIRWYNKNKTKIPPLALTILFHHKFEKIHPFTEGNGEVGRLLINYFLIQLNYPPIIIPCKYKEKYFCALSQADKAVKKDLLNTDMKYYKPLIDFMQKQFIKTYWDNYL